MLYLAFLNLSDLPLLPLLFTPSLITVILFTINYLSLNYPVSSRSRTLLLVLSLKLLSPVISLPSYALHWLRIIECIQYKLLSLTYKVLTITQPPYLHNLISVQCPRGTRFSSVVTLAQPPTSSSLKITDRSFCYASPYRWNQLLFRLSYSVFVLSFSLFFVFHVVCLIKLAILSSFEHT